MKYIVNAAQMKYADQYTIRELGVPSMVLMERAALQTVNAMKERQIDMSHALVVCGSGNNGGDGFAIARLLLEEGHQPDVVFVGNMHSRSEETISQMQILTKMGASIGNSLRDVEYSAIIDAVFGIGLSRAIEGRYQEIIERMNAYSGVKVAVDIASGISADTGAILGCAFQADLTVTFAYEKMGQILFPGRNYSGEVIVKPIGIRYPDVERTKEICFTYEKSEIGIQLPKRAADSNKGTYGKVLCITGSKGMSGAAYLSAKAAYLSGAGLVQIYTEESNRIILQQLLPEAIITTYNEDDENPFYELPELLEWASVICMGCGLGMSGASKALVEVVLKHSDKPMVIDADAINILSDYSEEKKKALLKKKRQCVLTPHMKELSRLCGIDVMSLKNKRTNYARSLVQDVPVTLVMKDSCTLVTCAEQKMYLNKSGNAAMAKAGAGDVLAGIITGFMAQKVPVFDAATLAVYLHGLAGDYAKESCGAYSVLAEDILSEFRNVLIDLEEK